MNTKIIIETARKTLDGTMSFPEVVGQLLAAGVEYYHVDYVGLRKTFYSAEGDAVVTLINYEDLPPARKAISLFCAGNESLTLAVRVTNTRNGFPEPDLPKL